MGSLYRPKGLRLQKIYYLLKPLIPRRLQVIARRLMALYKRHAYANTWIIDEESSCAPEGWRGWPEKKQFALVLTHDVETSKGQEKCRQLVKVEKSLGFRSSFNFVPERYPVSSELRHFLESEGFEVGVHGLYHDGKYYKSEQIFRDRATRINDYLKKWKSVGFRTPSMLHNLQWIHALNIDYDASTFDTDPFQPQPDGMKTIFPFFVRKDSMDTGYVELPYTLHQDFTLFVLLRETSIEIWKQKLDWIADHGGMALLITHPDYMDFEGSKLYFDEYPSEYYANFLKYIKDRYEGLYWHVLPKEISRFWVSIIPNK